MRLNKNSGGEATDISAEINEEIMLLEKRLAVDSIEKAYRFPQFFQIETIRLCNARCPFCAIDKWDKTVPTMDDRLWLKVADEIINHKDWVRMVDIQRAGEPLMDHKLDERIKYLKSAGIRFVNISTNASLLFPNRAESLLKSGINEVLLSIDSVDKSSYEELRKGLSYEGVISNIRNFFALRDKINPQCIIRVRGVATKSMDDPEFKDEMKKWHEFWEPIRSNRDRIYFKKLHTWGNKHENPNPTYKYSKELRSNPCIAPWSTFHVTTSGRVPLCGQDMDAEMNMGDCNLNTIEEIWNSRSFTEVRRKHATGMRNEISFCQGCKLFDVDFSVEERPDYLGEAGEFLIKPN